MKVKTKKVYYCEFCNKHLLVAHAIKTHEKHCTKNPERECRMCGGVYDNKPDSFTIKYGRFGSKHIEVTGEECPACVLSFVRLNNISEIYFLGTNNPWMYKDAVDKWHKETREEYY